jgi:hypothetical protein
MTRAISARDGTRSKARTPNFSPNRAADRGLLHTAPVPHALTVALAALATVAGCASTSFSGCGSDGAPTDAGHSMAPDVPGVDAHVSGTAPPLAPCTDTSVCADAPGVACLTDVAGGACTRHCTSASDCGSSGACVANTCLRACSPGTGDCIAHAGACVAGSMTTPPYCAPVCYPSARLPSGYPSCIAGLVCDPYTGTCVASANAGLDDGAPCNDATECRGGECLLDTDYPSQMPTGFLGGMCVSYGVVPSPSAYRAGAPLPQGSCPDGSAVPPTSAGAAYGDLGLCLPTCASPSDCRAGYTCTHLEGGGMLANGLCLPIDCSTGAPCPTGTACSSSSGWLGHPVCARTP